MAYEHILLEVADGWATITLNRPEKRNALTVEMMHEVHHCLTAVAADTQVKVIVFKGAGPAFCAGHDLVELTMADVQGLRRIFLKCTEMMLAVRAAPQPVVAAVHGTATAAGCQLVAACDLAVAADTARFATPGVRIGFFCSTPMVPLSRAVGRKRALEMLFTGEMISASQAADWGLINQVVPAAELEAAVEQLVAKICRASRSVLSTGKRAFYRQVAMAEELALGYASEVMAVTGKLPAAVEGMTAFLEKREPRWPEDD